MKSHDSGGERSFAAAPRQDQFALEGFARSTPTDRLFFAIFPDAVARERIAELAREIGTRHALSGDPLRTDRFHVTLFHLGDHAGVPQGIVDAASRAATLIDPRGFDVAFDRVGSFAGGDRKPCVLLGPEGESPLQAFQRTLGARLAAGGLRNYVKRDFTPHVTLRYVRTPLPTEQAAPIHWKVREFALVHSLIGQTEYRILSRWPLRD